MNLKIKTNTSTNTIKMKTEDKEVVNNSQILIICVYEHDDGKIGLRLNSI